MFPLILISGLMLWLQEITCRNNLETGAISEYLHICCFLKISMLRHLRTKMQGMYDAYMKTIFGPLKITIKYNLEPLTRIHLYSTNASEPEPTGSITYVYIFGIVAIFLVLIAAMNYMNLATARSARRAREVGSEKSCRFTTGTPLVLQFLSESLVFTIISLIISIILIIVLLPKFNLLAGKSFDSSCYLQSGSITKLTC